MPHAAGFPPKIQGTSIPFWRVSRDAVPLLPRERTSAHVHTAPRGGGGSGCCTGGMGASWSMTVRCLGQRDSGGEDHAGPRRPTLGHAAEGGGAPGTGGVLPAITDPRGEPGRLPLEEGGGGGV